MSHIDPADRRALEHVIGSAFDEHPQVIINVVDLNAANNDETTASRESPPWANIYEGLSDEEVDRLDQAIRQRANLTRHFE